MQFVPLELVVEMHSVIVAMRAGVVERGSVRAG